MLNNKPIAWHVRHKTSNVWHTLDYKPDLQEWSIQEPLYSKKSLALTEEQFSEFQKAYDKNSNVYGFMKDLAYEEYPTLRDIFDKGKSAQAELAQLLADFNPDYPEGSVKIVPDAKWFVEINTDNEEHKYLVIGDVVNYYVKKSEATAFDLESDTQPYLIPGTKAVELSIEDLY